MFPNKIIEFPSSVQAHTLVHTIYNIHSSLLYPASLSMHRSEPMHRLKSILDHCKPVQRSLEINLQKYHILFLCEFYYYKVIDRVYMTVPIIDSLNGVEFFKMRAMTTGNKIVHCIWFDPNTKTIECEIKE